MDAPSIHIAYDSVVLLWSDAVHDCQGQVTTGGWDVADIVRIRLLADDWEDCQSIQFVNSFYRLMFEKEKKFLEIYSTT